MALFAIKKNKRKFESQKYICFVKTDFKHCFDMYIKKPHSCMVAKKWKENNSLLNM